MKILIHKDGHQLGPFYPDDIERHLESGALSLDDQAWTEGQSDWKPLSEILGVGRPAQAIPFGALEPPRAVGEEESSPPARLQQTAESLVTKAMATVALTKKHAERKMIELVDLRGAHALLGKKAYESGRVSARYAYLVSQIDTLLTGIDSRPGQNGLDAPDSTGGVRGGTAEKAQTQKLDQLFSDLGRKLREDGVADGPLKREIEATNKAFAGVAALDQEIAQLSSQAYPWARRPRLVAGIAISALVLYLGVAKISATYSRWSEEKRSRIMQAQAAKEQARLAAETAESLRKQAEEQKLAREQEAELRSAQTQMEAERREAERQEEVRRKDAQAAMAARERERDREEERRQKAEKDAESLRKAELAKEQEKQNRTALATERFSQVVLSPNIVLSTTLRGARTRVDLLGQDLPQIQQLVQQRDYLNLLGFVRGTRYTEYPTSAEIESGLRMLMSKEFRIVLTTTFQKTKDQDLYLITFPNSESTIAKASMGWQHDGKEPRYSHKWSPSDGPVIVLTGNSTTARAPVESYDQSARKQCEALRKQKLQGVIDETNYRASVAAIRKAGYEALVKWAATR